MNKFFFALVLAVAPMIFANVFRPDDRISYKPIATDPLSRIGTLTNYKTMGRGTAYLVSPCYVLSNFHVAVSDEGVINDHQTSNFILPSGESEVAVTLIHGDYVDQKTSREEDWALVRLNNCLGRKYGWFELNPISSQALIFKQTPIILAGFPSDKITTSLTYDPLCFVRDLDWSHDCGTRPGNSGSPLLMLNSKNKYQVVAMTVSAQGDFAELISEYDHAIGNRSLGVEGFYDRVHPLIEEDIKKNAIK